MKVEPTDLLKVLQRAHEKESPETDVSVASTVEGGRGRLAEGKKVNLEQRKRIYLLIQKGETLLDYAIRTSDKGEENRFRRELLTLIEMSE